MKMLVLALILILSQSVYGNLVINEVLSNEPGSSTTLEWIELYNDSDSVLLLSNYTINVLKLDTLKYTLLLPSLTVDAHAYQVLCKNLYSASNEASFESYWGNSTKVWGDSDYELNTPEPIEMIFNLSNGDGTIQLFEGLIEVSTFSWDEDGTDAVSWERKFLDSTIILQSVSKGSSTPGIVNSVTLLQHDISIDSVIAVVENFNPIYSFHITNRGFTDIYDAKLCIYDANGLLGQNQFELPLLLSDSSVWVDVLLESDNSSLYTQKLAVVYTQNDNRSSNDTLDFIEVSSQYPPLLISEFLAHHQVDKDLEWVEIYNRSSTQINLQDWYIGDALKIYPIILNSFMIDPNQYVVLTKSIIKFMNVYPLFDGILIELANWATLNNDEDIIRLVDNFGIVAEKISYSELYEDNYTMSRELFNGTYQWGRSSEQFGTPGYANELFQIHRQVKINLTTKYISPDGDGFEDRVIIDIDVPYSEKYTLKLYDINGSIVKTLIDGQKYIANSIEWDGLDDKNARLPIGIYVLYLTTDEGLSTKETIVIAR